MKFAVLGWNYRKTPIEVRELLSLPPEQRRHLATELKNNFLLDELLILSTCNRTELYFKSAQPLENTHKLLQHLSLFWGIKQLADYSYTIYDLEAVEHLFKVASSLDSMVLGEPQILGQLKDAYLQFDEALFLGGLCKYLFQKAFSTAKRVRTETQIANFAVSISFAAVELAKRIFEDLSNQTVMIIGAGEMAELAARHLIKSGVSRLLVTNRTFSNAVSLAEKYQGSAIRFEQMTEYLIHSDIVIGSTGASKPVVTFPMVKSILKQRKGRPMFFIDIAVPRDIESQINELNNVYCYDIDDLQTVVDQNKIVREQQAQKALVLIQEEVHNVQAWFKVQNTLPTVRSLRGQFHGIAENELKKMSSKLKDFSPDQIELVERLVHNVVHKLLHKPTCNLKQVGQQDDMQLYLESIIEIFELSPTSLTLEKSKTPPLKVLSGRKSTS
ncbi:glutamyl-tRNA reductase [Deltaproteobacteria bacterium TL4]